MAVSGSTRDYQQLSAPLAIPPQPNRQAARTYVYAPPPLGLSARYAAVRALAYLSHGVAYGSAHSCNDDISGLRVARMVQLVE